MGVLAACAAPGAGESMSTKKHAGGLFGYKSDQDKFLAAYEKEQVRRRAGAKPQNARRPAAAGRIDKIIRALVNSGFSEARARAEAIRIEKKDRTPPADTPRSHGAPRRASPLAPRLVHAQSAGRIARRTVNIQTPHSLEELLAVASIVISADTFAEFLRHMQMFLPGPLHKHHGVFSGQRIQVFQNWLLVENYKYQLTDAQLLAVMRAEFPQADGAVFTGDLDKGLSIVAGIRAHLNRDGHHGKSPREMGLPPSESYGTFS